MITHEKLQEVVTIQHGVGKIDNSLDEVMDFVVRQTAFLINADGVMIEMIEDDDLICHSATGLLENQLGMRIQRKGSVSESCIATGKLLRSNEQECGYPSMVIVPLKNETSIVGVLKAVSETPQKFDTTDNALLELIAGLLTASNPFVAEYDSDTLFYRATYDKLTGIANRSHFMDRLHHAVFQSDRTQRPLAVLIINMDKMSVINEQYGRPVGDALLHEYVTCLQSAVRLSDTVARIGGDEFAMILNSINVPGDIDITIKRIHEESAIPLLHDGGMYVLRASIGAAYYPGDADNIDELLVLANQRMRAVKEAKKQSQSIFQPLIDL